MKQIVTLPDSKPHYQILDGLRGVAAIVVVLFHIFEAHSGGDRTKQIINHGYLAVDFFFLLSGFVISYAYDDRWGGMTLKQFFLRRVVRLHPMIIAGSVVGALLFYFQDSATLGWGGISEVPAWKTFMVMLIGCTLIPVGQGLDIRGWREMHPLNGPAWSLFFEYVANILYAIVLRRLNNIALSFLVLVAAGCTLWFGVSDPQGDFVGGWTIDDPRQVMIGFIRLSFPFLAGMLLARTAKLKFIRYAFPIASVLLVTLLFLPRIAPVDVPWVNGLYESVCVILVFPLIIWLGAGGKTEGANSSKLCKFLGDLSYPIYITHYPLIYIYTAWVTNENLSIRESWHMGLLTAGVAVLLAYCCMRFYDLPVRSWLQRKLFKARS